VNWRADKEILRTDDCHVMATLAHALAAMGQVWRICRDRVLSANGKGLDDDCRRSCRQLFRDGDVDGFP
jgi:hypothetical protein